jgi:hypothetical protein
VDTRACLDAVKTYNSYPFRESKTGRPARSYTESILYHSSCNETKEPLNEYSLPQCRVSNASLPEYEGSINHPTMMTASLSDVRATPVSKHHAVTTHSQRRH